MDSWDDEEFEVPNVIEQKPIAVTWDDEEEEDEPAAPVATTDASQAQGPLKPKQLKKKKLKELEQKRLADIALTKARLAQQADETDAERKAREKASIEEADFEAALDAFAPKRAEATAAKEDGEGGVDAAVTSMRLLSLADHEKFGEVVGNRISTSSAKYALEAIKVILTLGSANLSADDMKDLATIINVIKNDKIAAAKPKGKKKKQTGRQGYANVERAANTRGGGNAVYDDMDGGDYDDFDDFM